MGSFHQRTLAAAVLIMSMIGLLHAAPTVGSDRVRVALPGNSMGYLPLIVAIHRGFFKDENIDLELIRLVPTVAHNALLLNEVECAAESPARPPRDRGHTSRITRGAPAAPRTPAPSRTVRRSPARRSAAATAATSARRLRNARDVDAELLRLHLHVEVERGR